jgi:predicted alpha/beta-hydrolase family hydrolase
MRATGMSADPAHGVFETHHGHRCSYWLQVPAAAPACFVLAHGAGAGPAHPFLRMVAIGLQQRGIATLRFAFPGMERGSKRPDPPRIAQAAVRGAVAQARALLPHAVLVAGGKSFGGRMSAHAQAEQALPGVRALVFLGFPLHPAAKPGAERAAPLFATDLPLLFVQGTRDALAEPTLIDALVQRLGSRATLAWIEAADHSFRVPARGARTQSEADHLLVETVSQWILRIAQGERR